MIPFPLVFAHVRQLNAPKISVVLLGIVAFALSFMLDGVVFGMNALVSKLSDLELVVNNRSHGQGGLPLAYRDRIQGIDGVASVWPVNRILCVSSFKSADARSGYRNRAGVPAGPLL